MPIEHGHLAHSFGRLFIEAGYFSGMYFHGEDSLVDFSALHYIQWKPSPYFVIINLRIWKLVLSVSWNIKVRKEAHPAN